jgi:hypothetical protein
MIESIVSRPMTLTEEEISNVVGKQYMKRCLLLLIVLWGVVAAHWVMRGDGVSGLVTVLAAIATACPYLQARFGVSKLKRRLSVPHQFEITERNLRRMFEDGVESSYPWHLFDRAVFSGEYLLLFLSWSSYVIVPTRGLEPEDLSKLKGVLDHNGL